MQIDVLFIDAAASKPYNWESLENDSLGGSESTTIRLAEGFAGKGLKVAIVQRFEIPVQQSPNGVHYLPPYWAKAIKPKNVIYLRVKGVWETYPNARKFLWLHDASTEDHNNLSAWVEGMVKNDVLAIAVSDWHVKNVSRYAPGIPIKCVYSPLDETCYQPPQDYDKNQLVWLASPHKGLKEALGVFKDIQNDCAQMKLVVFNPGYFEEDLGQHLGVVFLSKQKRDVLRRVVSRSLCLFYPTDFEETFGLIAAESNALGIPVASYGVAALAESTIDYGFRTKHHLVQAVFEWRDGKRPIVKGNDLFKFDKVYSEWHNLLKL